MTKSINKDGSEQKYYKIPLNFRLDNPDIVYGEQNQ